MANKEDPTVTSVPLPPAAHDPSPRPLLVAARSSGPGLPSSAPLLTEPGRNVRRRRRPLSPAAPGGSAARRRLVQLDDEIRFVPDEAMHSTPRPFVSAAAAAGVRPGGEGSPSSPEERNNGDTAHFDDSFLLHIDPDDVSSDSDSDFSPGQDDGDQVTAFNFYTYFVLSCFDASGRYLKR
jgi:hypothetical protein